MVYELILINKFSIYNELYRITLLLELTQTSTFKFKGLCDWHENEKLDNENLDNESNKQYYCTERTMCNLFLV